MLEAVVLIAFCWLFFKAVGLAFKAAWGVTKLLASVLFALAVPLLIPVGMVAAAFGLLKKCG